MLVKFPHACLFGTCKATALLRTVKTVAQKFFGEWGLRLKKSKFFARKGKSIVNSVSINYAF